MENAYDIVAFTKYQCIKFLHQHRIVKVQRNQLAIHATNEKRIKDVQPSEVQGKNILVVINQNKEQAAITNLEMSWIEAIEQEQRSMGDCV